MSKIMITKSGNGYYLLLNNCNLNGNEGKTHTCYNLSEMHMGNPKLTGISHHEVIIELDDVLAKFIKENDDD